MIKLCEFIFDNYNNLCMKECCLNANKMDSICFK